MRQSPRPGQRHRPNPVWRNRARLAAVAVALLAAAILPSSAVLSASPNAVPANLVPSLANAARDVSPAYRDGCHSLPYDPAIHPCVYGDTAGDVTIVAFGDSHAQQWVPALIAEANTRAWRIVVLTKSSCPSVQVLLAEPTFPGADASCNTWRARAEAWLAANPPDLILITNTRGYGLIDAAGRPIPSAEWEPTWEAGLATTLAAMPARSRVLVLGDTPRSSLDVPTCLRRHLTWIPACEVAQSIALSPAHDLAEQGTAQAAGVAFASLNSVICPGDPCPVIDGHVLMWRNETHLTATYARRLGPDLAAVILDALALQPATNAAVAPDGRNAWPDGPDAWPFGIGRRGAI